MKSETRSGIPLEPIYGTEQAGTFPFARGVQKDMYRGRLWTMRQYAGFGSAEESNARYQYLISQGTTGLSVAFDLPTQLGYDPDHPRCRGEVGKVGVSICSIEDMDRLFQNIDLSKISTSLTINATAATLLGFYVAIADRRGLKRSELRGTVQNDVLKEYVARGNYIYPPKGALRIATDMFAWCAAEVPKWNPISISGYHIREAGSTAVHELAFTFADAIAYVQAAVDQGMDVDSFAGQLSFFFNVHNDFFEEIAKFRAARRIWARIMRERFGAKDPRSLMCRFHCQTAGSTLTAQQPENNIVRVTLQALAAVLGGTQSLHTNSYDEALALPTEQSAKVALRTQQVIAFESQVTQVVDPLGGSPFIESLTEELEKRAFEVITQIDSLGGTVACIESGWIQAEIAASAYKDQLQMDAGTLKVVGVNCFQDSAQDPRSKPKLMRVPESLEREACERIQNFRAKRSPQAVAEALRQLREGAQGTGNTQALILNAVQSCATLGEVADVLREEFGLYQDR